MEIKTLEQLKAHFPELTNELTESVRNATEQAVKDELNKKHENEIAQAKVDAVAEYKESEEGKKYEKAFNAIVESLKPFLPETIQLSESELGREVANLKESVTNKDSALRDAQTKLQLAENELAKVKAEAEVAKAIDAKITGHKFESALRTRLAECKSAEEVEAKFTSEVAFLESIGFQGEVPAGQGVNENHNKGDQGEQQQKNPLNERNEKMRRLAGLK